MLHKGIVTYKLEGSPYKFFNQKLCRGGNAPMVAQAGSKEIFKFATPLGLISFDGLKVQCGWKKMEM
jgi:hypothetical protein